MRAWSGSGQQIPSPSPHPCLVTGHFFFFKKGKREGEGDWMQAGPSLTRRQAVWPSRYEDGRGIYSRWQGRVRPAAGTLMLATDSGAK